uniref:Uncharacterized protein n=1 Tax=Lepeophtheirus salmonis TaxID=72036 RepID=A0A0K2TNE9_LEPSM
MRRVWVQYCPCIVTKGENLKKILLCPIQRFL